MPDFAAAGCSRPLLNMSSTMQKRRDTPSVPTDGFRLNERSMNRGGSRNPEPAPCYNLVVIGAGTAGLTAARAAATLGAKVALVERNLMGGTCLNIGCVPSKVIIRSSRVYAEMRNAWRYGACVPPDIRVDFASVMQRVRDIRAHLSLAYSAERLAVAGVDVFFGEASFSSHDSIRVNDATLRFRKAIVATGARPDMPNVPGLAEAGYLTNETVFDLTEPPRSLLVIGGGPLGCEMAQALCRLGVQTTIVHSRPLFLPREERDAAQILSDALARDGINVRLNTNATRVRLENGHKVVELVSDDYSNTVTVDAILTGTGRVPNLEGLNLEAAGVDYEIGRGIQVDDFLCSSNRRIYAAGDVCLEYKFSDTADASARIAVHNALIPGRRRLSSLTIPWCTYTDPEIAHVGLYVRQANARGIPVKTFTVPMHDVHRAIADNEEAGFVKIIVAGHTDRILGATIVARHAGEMISEITLAMAAGVGLRTLTHVIHAYPTQAEGIKMAADAYERTRMTPRKHRLTEAWLRWQRW